MAKFLFVVQGEGRGHLTQALALQDILHNAGHKVVAVLVGKSYRKIPDFFITKMKLYAQQIPQQILHNFVG
jgi:UDP:flavonoid glycosyltransferase YjiC (YdhE family)